MGWVGGWDEVKLFGGLVQFGAVWCGLVQVGCHSG